MESSRKELERLIAAATKLGEYISKGKLTQESIDASRRTLLERLSALELDSNELEVGLCSSSPSAPHPQTPIIMCTTT